MSRRLILDPDALRDLDDIFDYLAQRNSAAAIRYVRELRERWKLLPRCRRLPAIRTGCESLLA